MPGIPPKDPMQMLQELMRGGGGGGQPSIPGPAMQGQLPPETAMPDMESVAPSAGESESVGGAPSDEEMLDSVHNAMGKRTSDRPPPGSGMKWQNLQEDQAALQADPSPENVAAFTDYWGEENLPEGIEPAANEPDADDATSY